MEGRPTMHLLKTSIISCKCKKFSNVHEDKPTFKGEPLKGLDNSYF